MPAKWAPNIQVLRDYLAALPDTSVDYCGISNTGDFTAYEGIVPFKYKVANPKLQIAKVCDFITDHQAELDYDWFVKIRPDMLLLEPLSFEGLPTTAISARARCYTGPKRIEYAMSIGGEGFWKNVKDCVYDEVEKRVILDDMLFIFHRDAVAKGGFKKVNPPGRSIEFEQTPIWVAAGLGLNVIGIHMRNMSYVGDSGHLNLSGRRPGSMPSLSSYM